MNNDELPKVKQINRIAKVIKVDEFGNVKESNEILPEEPIKNENVEKLDNIQDKNVSHDSSTAIFITVILIIIACVAFFIVYIYLPNNYHGITGNEETPTTKTQEYYFDIIDLSDNDIDFQTEMKINDKFMLKIEDLNAKKNIKVNDFIIATANKIYKKVSIVDNILFMFLINNEPRQNRVIGVTTDGKILADISSIPKMSGMSVNEVIFNPTGITLIASRIYDSKLILSSNFGDVNGSDICNSSTSEEMLATGEFEINYKGNNKLSDAKKISGETIKEYVNNNNMCQ
jgi:hypothetical protein